MTVDPDPTRRPPLPRRALIGAALVGLVVAGATAAGLVGAIDAPRSETFRFTRGTVLAPGEAERLRGFLSRVAAEDRLVLRVTGHSGTRGDAAANLALSEARAEAVRAVAAEIGLPPARLDWVGGVGGGDPLPRGDGESAREWESRLSRVTITAAVRP